MNTEEMNLALAEFAGTRCHRFCKDVAHTDGHVKSNRMAYIVICANCDAFRWGYDNLWREEQHEDFLDYCNDLNALRTVEEKLTEEQFGPYVFELMQIVGAVYSSAYDRRITSATAAQKAGALVRALGLEGK